MGAPRRARRMRRVITQAESFLSDACAENRQIRRSNIVAVPAHAVSLDAPVEIVHPAAAKTAKGVKTARVGMVAVVVPLANKPGGVACR